MQLIKRLTQTLAAGSTSLTFTDSMINDNSIIDVKGDSFEIYPTAASQTGTSVTVTFDAQTEAHSILLLINNIVSLSDPEIANLLDVDLSTLSDDDILTYDEDTDKWINANARTAENIAYDNTDSGLEATNVQDAIDELSVTSDITANVTFPNATLVQGGVFRNGNICIIKCNIRITTEIGNNTILIQNIPKPLMKSLTSAFIKICPVRSGQWTTAVSKWHFQVFSNSTVIRNATQTLAVGDIVDLDWTYIIDEA